MLQRPFRKAVLTLGLATLLLPLTGQAQVREVLSKQVSVGRDEASLVLEFSDRSTLEVSLRDGAVLIDGERVGSFEAGDELDLAWRELLGEAVSLEDGPLTQALDDWTAPADLAGSLADAARAIDGALEASSSGADAQASADGSVSVSIGDERSLLTVLLGSAERIGLLPEALSGISSDVRVHVGEDVEIGEDEVVEADLVVIAGDVVLRGLVEGDVVVIDGSLDMREGSEVEGAVRLADARLLGDRGTVADGIVNIEESADFDLRVEVDADRLRDEVREELRRELRISDRERGERGSLFTAPFRTLGRAAGGVAENVLMILILGLLGAAAVAFAGNNVEVIAETARRSPGRSAMVGLAGTFLLLPAWVLGAVALAVSIIGIPVAIAWLPLFPLAALLAGVLGYLAVARNAGEWLADSGYPWTGWIRKSNPLLTVLGGLVGLMALFIAANVLSIVPFFGFVTGLVGLAAAVVTFVAVQVGFGAVLLTRAGRRREYWGQGYGADEAWEAAMNVDVEDDAAGSTRGPDEEDRGEVEDDA